MLVSAVAHNLRLVGQPSLNSDLLGVQIAHETLVFVERSSWRDSCASEQIIRDESHACAWKLTWGDCIGFFFSGAFRKSCQPGLSA